jgi:hypothetical protein
MSVSEQRETSDAESEMSFWWALLSNRGQRGVVAIAGILLRNAMPLIGVLVLNWSAQKFLMLAMINFGWNWALLGVWNMGTSALIASHREGKPVPSSKWIVVAFAGALVFCIVTCAFGFPVFYLSSAPIRFDVLWWIGVAMTLISPLPNVVGQMRDAAAADLSDAQVETIAQQRRQLLIVSIVPIVAAYWLLSGSPDPIVVKLVAVGYVLFSALCELRPDMTVEFARLLPRE